MKGAKKAAADGSKGKGKKNPKKKPNKKELRKTLTIQRIRRIPKRRARSLMIHVSLCLLSPLHSVIPPVMGCVGVEPVWTIQYPLLTEVLIG